MRSSPGDVLSCCGGAPLEAPGLIVEAASIALAPSRAGTAALASAQASRKVGRRSALAANRRLI